MAGEGNVAPDLRRSYHASFWDGGIQALFIVDGGNFRNPHYHLPSDYISTLNFEFMKHVVKATLATVAELAIPVSAAVDEVDLSLILSVEEFDIEGLVVYPNPSNGLFTLQNKTNIALSNATVYDINGRHIKTLNLVNMSDSATIDISSVASGMYFISIRSKNSKHIVKLFKE